MDVATDVRCALAISTTGHALIRQLHVEKLAASMCVVGLQLCRRVGIKLCQKPTFARGFCFDFSTSIMDTATIEILGTPSHRAVMVRLRHLRIKRRSRFRLLHAAKYLPE